MCNFNLVLRFKLLIWILTSSSNIAIPFWMSGSIASYLILFLLFHITHRVIINKTLMNSVPLLILKYPAILSVYVMAKPLSMWFFIIHSVTFQILSRPLHVVSRCSTFSTTFEQTLHDPSEYCILQRRLYVLIWPWNISNWNPYIFWTSDYYPDFAWTTYPMRYHHVICFPSRLWISK